MTSKTLSLAKRLALWAEDFPSDFEFTGSKPPVSSPKIPRRKKPRKLVSEFVATPQQVHATSRKKSTIFHEKPNLTESPAKRVRVSAEVCPFNRPHSSRTVTGMHENLKNLSKHDDQGIQILHVDCIRVSQLNVKGALTDEKTWYLKAFIKEHKPDIILINEFGQTREVPVYPKIETYKLVTYDLKSAFSGVAIYVQNSLLNSVMMLKNDHNLAFSQIAGIKIQGVSIYTI